MPGAILLFGRLKDAFGVSFLPFPAGDLSPATAGGLRARLAAIYPDQAGLLESWSVRIAVNQEVVQDEATTPVAPSDEIALMPPLSGG